MRVKRLLVTVALPAMSLVLTTCSSPAPEAASSVQGLPDYAYRSAQATRGYQIALEEKDLLARLPCYCGCGQDPQYKSLADCFFEESGDFRSHAANCQVCLDEAEDAARWKAQGLPTKAIRDQIDRNYEGRGKPTDTPPVLD